MYNSNSSLVRSMAAYCGKEVCPGNVVSLDVDILGRGVLASFITTVGLTIGSIIIGYFFECLPGARTNTVDEIFFRGSRQTRRWMRGCLHKILRRKIRQEPANWAQIESRASTLQQFVLALSDQQLITGTAILVAVFAEPCDISVISFRTATAMAWFSSTTHLATLSILHDYFETRRWVLTCRVIIMLIFMVLLVSAEFLTQSQRLSYSENWDAAFSCVVTQTGPRSILPEKSNQIFSLVLLMVWLASAYVNRLSSLYSRHWRALRSWPWRLSTECLGLDCSPPLEKKASATFKTIQDRLDNKLWRTFLPPVFIIGISLVAPVQHELSNSFLYEIVWFFFGLSFGINQVVKLLNSKKVKALGAEGFRRITGFGQLLPLLLLAMPLLAIVEGTCDSESTLPTDTAQLLAIQPVPAEEPSENGYHPSYILQIDGRELKYRTVSDLPGSYFILTLQLSLWIGATQSFAILASNRQWVNLFDVVPLYAVALTLWLWGTVWWEMEELIRDWKNKGRK